jgi:hypothetical protein
MSFGGLLNSFSVDRQIRVCARHLAPHDGYAHICARVHTHTHTHTHTHIHAHTHTYMHVPLHTCSVRRGAKRRAKDAHAPPSHTHPEGERGRDTHTERESERERERDEGPGITSHPHLLIAHMVWGWGVQGRESGGRWDG